MCPEISELVAMYLYLVWLLRYHLGFFSDDDEKGSFVYRDSSAGWPLVALWIDVTIEECISANLKPKKRRTARDERMAQYLPITIQAGDKFERGSNSWRVPVWPPGFSSLDGFVLVNVHVTARTIVFDFGVCRLHMHFGLHTSMQVMTRECWREDMQEVPAKVVTGVVNNKLKTEDGTRKAKIALALEFETHVIAFLSKDMVCTPSWSVEVVEYPPDIFPTFDTDGPVLPSPIGFYQYIGRWLTDNWHLCDDSKTLAVDFIRNSTTSLSIVPGTGAYTGCEDFTSGGLWPGLTVVEVFKCPSRFARMIEALYCIMWRAKRTFLRRVIRPAMHSGIMISLTEQQRLDFFSNYILVWRKEMATVHCRQVPLIESALKSIRDHGIVDVDPFEPTLLDAAFRKDIHLAELIFGTTPAGITPSKADDPITAFYRSKGLLGTSTHLPHYDPVFLPRDNFLTPSNRRYVPTYAYKSQKTVWSLLPPPPHLISKLMTQEERAKNVYTHIIRNTQDVVIGPLEFYGNAVPIHTGRTLIVASNKTAAVRTGYHSIRALRTEARKALKLGDTPGKRKRALTQKENNRIEAWVRKKCATLGVSYPQDQDDTGDSGSDSDTAPLLLGLQPAEPAEPTEPPRKRRRKADLQLVQDAAATAAGTSSPISNTRRTRSKVHPPVLADVSNTTGL